MTGTDTMPQGAALSADGKRLAIVESGFNPPTLRLYDTADLAQVASISLPGAFGRPLWLDRTHVLVAGVKAGALLDVDVASQSVRKIAMPARAYPVALARGGETFAVGSDGDGALRIGLLQAIAAAKAVHVGAHVGGVALSPDTKLAFASNWAGSSVVEVDVTTLRKHNIATGLHPSALLWHRGRLYVAETDAGTVGVYDPATGKRLREIALGESPNSLAQSRGTIFVTQGAANTVAVIRNDRVVGRIASGWYPTDAIPAGNRLFIVDGKGEGSTPNPDFNARRPGYYDYVASIEYGSIRTYDLRRGFDGGNPQGALGWQAVPQDTVLRAGGPIRHVFFILKENRSYDQVLGDVAAGNGDRKLVWFGARVTPNEHAFAARFGLFDNTYASGEVSESGHNWADAGFVNDYVERYWPVIYGDRGVRDDTLSGAGAAVPAGGYIWQVARAAGLTFRDYGELVHMINLTDSGTTTPPNLAGLYDSRYVGWNLDYSDLDRIKEWRREFDAYVRSNDVPNLEYMWLPNDHTYGMKPGKPTPEAYVATNDYAIGRMVDAISHSPVWKSSAIFIIEDDAQDGPDHVSDQRTTFFLASPYARGGVRPEHYSTMSVLRTMELILGLRPLSVYDRKAVPLYAAFRTTPDLRPYDVIAPKIDVAATNRNTPQNIALSRNLDYSRPDANER
jgi:DNA-binding beta-propeller fold protein YncE